MMISRRHFVASTFAATLASALHAEEKRPRHILLRNSWQTVNIGDIGHTPGILQLLADHLPDVAVTLWPSNIGNGVEEMLSRNFPKLRFAKTPEAVKQAFADCDFLLHGSGASFVARKQVDQWVTETAKPFGVFGITYGGPSDTGSEALLSKARFVYFRDSVSLQVAKERGVSSPIMEFGPDGAFGVKLRDDASATAFLKANGLEEGKFLCVIPRLRFSPYWKMRGTPMKPEDEKKNARNEEMKEHDHAPLRAAIEAVIKETNLKVLLCPEDESQMEIGRQMLFEPLPAEVKPRVVWREKYWLTDEAVSTYVRSAGLFGLEMHSPIMCIGNGIPAIVCRFAEQTTKGLMWRDIGLEDWLFDMDDAARVSKLTETVLALAKDPAAARVKAAKAKAFVEEKQKGMVTTLGRELAKG